MTEKCWMSADQYNVGKSVLMAEVHVGTKVTQITHATSSSLSFIVAWSMRGCCPSRQSSVPAQCSGHGWFYTNTSAHRSMPPTLTRFNINCVLVVFLSRGMTQFVYLGISQLLVNNVANYYYTVIVTIFFLCRKFQQRQLERQWMQA